MKEAIAAHALEVELRVMDDGEQAIGFMAQIDADPSIRRPDLFLLDLNLPKTSGLEVLARLRSSARCKNVPVLIMTSSDAEGDRANSATLGATAYFRKPAGYEAFLRIGELVRRLLGESSMAA